MPGFTVFDDVDGVCTLASDDAVNLDLLHVYAVLSQLVYEDDIASSGELDIPDVSLCLSIQKYSQCVDGRWATFLVSSAEHADPELVIAFCGTDSVHTFLVNLVPGHEKASAQGDARARVHRGYSAHYAQLKPQLLADVRRYLARAHDTPAITVVGHSLGGACASICALDLSWELAQSGASIGCATFGSPPAGNSAFCAEFNRRITRSYRVVDERDPAPRAEILFRNQVRTRIALPAESGGLTTDCVIGHLCSQIGQFGYVNRYLRQLGQLGRVDIDNHSIRTYINGITQARARVVAARNRRPPLRPRCLR
jgi:pimeloyl-ACP methyl ester carboxylesterase